MSRYLLACVVLVGFSPLARGESPQVGDLGRVGSVSFPTSCHTDVRAEFERGVALLHSFFYEEARRLFLEVAEKDPSCAMAQWGVAMTWYHPMWSAPDAKALAAGAAAVAKAKALTHVTPRERDYIGAVAAFYEGSDAGAEPGAPSCHGATPSYGGRAAAFEKAMARVEARNPDDVEASLFHAIVLVATAPPEDKAFRNQLRAAKTLEVLFRTHPDHPGVAHYLIHAYDFPPLAAKGLPAAKAYADIAPYVPHALHMPSHIFTRLGMWPDSISTNLRSADASRAYSRKFLEGATYSEELHAMDYAAYAYLQLGQDEKAKAIVNQIANVETIVPAGEPIAAYALSTIPARYAIERHEWAEAAALASRPRGFWKSVPFAEANLVFAQALGAARSAHLDDAEAGAQRLGRIRALIDPRGASYWSRHVEWQQLAISAWVEQGRGKTTQALALMKKAADLDDTLGKSPISPGEIVPARELLGDLLLAKGRADEALAAYETSLKANPNRFNALYGAAAAATKLGKSDVAKKFYGQLVAQADPQSKRPEVIEARAAMATVPPTH